MTGEIGRRFSVIIPVYNRPDELAELLDCLTRQIQPPYEVIVVDDGSAVTSRKVVEKFQNCLPIYYFEKPNEGQGYTRNFGMRKATGDFFVIFDSDALIEPEYLSIVDDYLNRHSIDFYGGPDTDHPDFTPVQKAISFAMTSFLTTGGIRGKKKNLGGRFHPRSFNMGLSRQVWEKTGGFRVTRMGEDIIFSLDALRMGFRSALIPEAFIYHKRRTSFRQFFRQIFFFGRARINIARYYPGELKPVHFFPSLFLAGLLSIFPLYWISPVLSIVLLSIYGVYLLLLMVDAAIRSKNIRVTLLSIPAALIQLTAYGSGLVSESWKKITEPGGLKMTGESIEYPS